MTNPVEVACRISLTFLMAATFVDRWAVNDITCIPLPKVVVQMIARGKLLNNGLVVIAVLVSTYASAAYTIALRFPFRFLLAISRFAVQRASSGGDVTLLRFLSSHLGAIGIAK